MKTPLRFYLMGCCVLFINSLVMGYELLDPERTWESPPIYIVDNLGLDSITDANKGVTAIVTAITSQDAWNGAGAGTVVNATAGSVSDWQLGDGIPMLNLKDPTGQCTGNCLAGTFTGFYETYGKGRNRKAWILDADIVTNTAYKWTSESEPDGCSGEFYIEGVQVHEIGHGLGLGHTNVAGATMLPSVAACNNSPATTGGDDESGIRTLYGSSNGGSSCSLGQASDSCSTNGQCCSGKCRGKKENKSCR